MFDLAIVGSGPAGCSAAMTARKRGLSAVVLGSADGSLARTPSILNYPGFPEISGPELLRRMRSQAAGLGAEFRTGLVREILPMGESFALSLGGDFVEARRVVLCTGARQPRLLPGEQEFLGRGVSYCGTCDGMLYRGKRIAILAESEESVQEAAFLAGICAEVHWFGKKRDGLDARVIPHEEKALEIRGTGKAERLLTSGGEMPFDGIFIFREMAAYSSMLPGLETEKGFIRTDRNMHTSVPGVYAAGDCTGQPLQAAKAVGEGCIAALEAAHSLEK